MFVRDLAGILALRFEREKVNKLNQPRQYTDPMNSSTQRPQLRSGRLSRVELVRCNRNLGSFLARKV